MLRLKDIPEEAMPEVLSLATELRQREDAERERAGRAREMAAAAEEIGVPQEYLERAAAEWHVRRVAEAAVQHRRKRTLTAAVVGALAAAGMVVAMQMVRPPESPVASVVPPAPVAAPRQAVSLPLTPERWTLNANPGTVATVSYRRVGDRAEVAVIRVERFAAAPGTPHRANYNAPLAGTPITRPGSVSFDARGEGLSFVRVYLENGALERWRSPALPIGADWRTHRLDLSRFEYQTRPSSGARWQVRPFRAPERAEQLSFKLGDFVNPATARGEVALDAVRVE